MFINDFFLFSDQVMNEKGSKNMNNKLPKILAPGMLAQLRGNRQNSYHPGNGNASHVFGLFYFFFSIIYLHIFLSTILGRSKLGTSQSLTAQEIQSSTNYSTNSKNMHS